MNEEDTASKTSLSGGVTIVGNSVVIQGDIVGGSKIVQQSDKILGHKPINCPACARIYIPSENKFACPNCGTATPKHLLN